MACTCRARILAANIGPNRFTHVRTVSWQMSMPRSKASRQIADDGGKPQPAGEHLVPRPQKGEQVQHKVRRPA